MVKRLVLKPAKKKGFGPPGGCIKQTCRQRVERTGFKLEQVEDMFRSGMTERQIAQVIHVTIDCIQGWKSEIPEFKALVKDWKADADDRVERSLLARAEGFEYEEISREQVESDGKLLHGDLAKVKRTKKLVPGDVNAQRFWLINRRPEEWRERSQHANLNADVKADDPVFRNAFFGVDFSKGVK